MQVRMFMAGAGLLLDAACLFAQAAPPAMKPAPAAWRQKSMSFGDAKPVLGLDAERSLGKASCSADGSAFFQEYGKDATAAGYDLFRIAADGNAKRVVRKMPPPEYDNVAVQDFFVAEHDLVTLLRAEKYDGDEKSSHVVETRFFLSTSDHDGDGAQLLALDLKFRPLKIAMFRSGEFMVLGWDMSNELPELALLKEDGSLRRYIDLDGRPSSGGFDMLSRTGRAGMPSDKVARLLMSARFTSFGDDVLLAQAGGTAPVHDLTAFGEDRLIPVKYPPGVVLHDIVTVGRQWMLVIRTSSLTTADWLSDDKRREKLQLFEFSAYNGDLVRELITEKPSVAEITCAPASKLAAMFEQPVPNANAADVSAGPTAQDVIPMQQVVAVAPR